MNVSYLIDFCLLGIPNISNITIFVINAPIWSSRGFKFESEDLNGNSHTKTLICFQFQVLEEFKHLTGWSVIDKLNESLSQYCKLILKTKTTTDKGNLKKMKADISGARTEKEKECKLIFAKLVVPLSLKYW